MLCRRYVRYYEQQFADARRLLTDPAAAGPAVAEFERAIALRCQRRHAIAVASGRQGMVMLLEAAGLRSGDEIVFPAYTLADLVVMARQHGWHPVPADIEEGSMNLDPVRFAAAVTPRTRAVVATHLFGVPCRIDEIALLARRHRLFIIEDCAHALGASLAGRPVGAFGDAAFFSFELTKTINTFGGGMVVTDDDQLAARLRARVAAWPLRAERLAGKISAAARELKFLRSPLFALSAWLFYNPATTCLVNRAYRALQTRGRLQDMRYHPMQAWCGLRQLAELADREARRRVVAEQLRARSPAGIIWQTVLPDAVANNYFCVVRFPGGMDAARARQLFLRHGVDVGIGPEIADDCTAGAGASVTQTVTRTAVQIPLHEELMDADLDRIVRAFRAVLAEAGR